MAYLLDANVFIEAKNRYYGLDFCPAFWDWITAENHAGRLFSIEKVGDELRAIVDDLSVWSGLLGSGFFLPPDSATLPAMAVVSNWATGGQYEQSAVNTFLQKADYYLVAYAIAHEHIVVTHEAASTSTKKIKIPDACIGLGVKCVSPFEMLRYSRARFVLDRAVGNS